MSPALLLARAGAEAIRDAALAAAPRECCGLIEGVREGGMVRATAIHPARNLAGGGVRDRFVIDPEVQFRLLRALRGTGREIVGCYHSHPEGAAVPSAADLEGAGEDGFIWLIAGLRDAKVDLAAFVYRAEAHAFAPLPIRPAT